MTANGADGLGFADRFRDELMAAFDREFPPTPSLWQWLRYRQPYRRGMLWLNLGALAANALVIRKALRPPMSDYGMARAILAGIQFVKWRVLAAFGYDPHQINREVSLRAGFTAHYRTARGRSLGPKERT